MDTRNLLPIGQFAQATGLSVTALRHYDAVGVLTPTATDPVSGYRHYAREQVDTAQLIRSLRQLDIPVDDIRELLRRRAEGGDAAGIAAELHARVRAAEQRVDAQRALLRGLIPRLSEGVDMSHDITLERRRPVRALACRGSVTLDGFVPFMDRSFQTLYTVAGRGPLQFDQPAFTLFHGRLEEEAATEIEACLPYAPDSAQPGDLPDGVYLVQLDETPFAGTLVEGPDAAYPAILTAYDAVASWISSHGFDFAGPAQETYHRWTGRFGAPGNRLLVGWAVRDGAEG
ncbi:MerR family transcriptional regulator [Streptomyces sp. CA-111067]|uniref:MerR family transcriptional regulator n=1 Tax=Streptomyces sp. CA-111067 TaxID=3240046 RepID=UPI003D99BD92